MGTAARSRSGRSRARRRGARARRGHGRRRVGGVVDQIATDGSSDQSSGVGFAVPSDLVAAEVEALASGEDVEHAYLGVATSGAQGSAEGALIAAIAEHQPGDEVTVEVERDSDSHTVKVRLGTQPAESSLGG